MPDSDTAIHRVLSIDSQFIALDLNSDHFPPDSSIFVHVKCWKVIKKIEKTFDYFVK